MQISKKATKEIWSKVREWREQRSFWGEFLPSLIIIVTVVFPLLPLHPWLPGKFPPLASISLIGMGAEGLRNIILILAGCVTWFFLYRRTKTAEQGVVVEQLTRAMEQLDNKNPYIRLCGILGLEQIAKSRGEERRKIEYILDIYLRSRRTPSDDKILGAFEKAERFAIEDVVKKEALRVLHAFASRIEDTDEPSS